MTQTLDNEKRPPAYSSQDEIRFIEGLGTWAPKHRAATEYTPEDILRRYLKAAERRVSWGTVDPLLIISFARKRLEEMRARSGIRGWPSTNQLAEGAQ